MIVYPKIRAFLAVAETLNFTRAAAQMYISQPALSKMISAFEHECGMTLFKRGNKSVELTTEGRLLYDRLKDADMAILQSIIDVKKIMKGRHGTLKLACGGFFTVNDSINDLFLRYAAEYPQFELDPEYISYTKLKEEPYMDNYDCFIMMQFDNIFKMKSVVLENKRPVFCIGRNNPLYKDRDKLDPSALKGCSFLCMQPFLSIGYRDYLMECCAAYGFEPDITRYCKSFHTMEALVSCGNYAYMTFEGAFKYSASAYIDAPLAKGMDSVLICNEEKMTPPLQAMLDLIENK